MVQRQPVFELVRPRVSALLFLGLLGVVTGCGGSENDTHPATIGGAASHAVAGAGDLGTNRSASGGRSQEPATGAIGGKSEPGTVASGGSSRIDIVQGTLSNPPGQGGSAAGGAANGGAGIVATTGGASPVGSSKVTGNGGAAVGGALATASSKAVAGTGSNTPGTPPGGPGGGGGTSGPARGGTSSVAGAGPKGGASPSGGTAPIGGTSVGTSVVVVQGGTPSTFTTVGTTTGGTPVGAAAVAEFTASYVTPYCKRLSECCTKGGFAPPTASACQDNELGFYSDSLADGTATVNSSGISALLGAIETSCDQPSYLLYGQLTAGTKPIGADCTDVSQCQGDSVICIVPQNNEVGKCVAAPRGRLGDSCAVDCDNTSVCRWSVFGGNMTQTAACWDEDGLRCDSQTNACVALAGIGKACEFVECGRHAECNNSTCVAKGKLGEDCERRSCESTLICNSNYKCEKMSIAWSGSCGS